MWLAGTDPGIDSGPTGPRGPPANPFEKGTFTPQ